MSFTSSLGSRPASPSPSSLPSTPRFIQIGFTPATSSTTVEIYPSAPAKSTQNPVCAYSSSSQHKSNDRRPSAYISDEDLFGDDDVPYLLEAPLPPRPAQAWAVAVAQPLLPPLPRSRRRSSAQKKRRTSSSCSGKK